MSESAATFVVNMTQIKYVLYVPYSLAISAVILTLGTFQCVSNVIGHQSATNMPMLKDSTLIICMRMCIPLGMTFSFVCNNIVMIN